MLQTGDNVRLQVVYMQHFGGFLLQRGGSAVLTARYRSQGARRA